MPDNLPSAPPCACVSTDARRCVEARYRRPMADDDRDDVERGDPCSCSCHDDCDGDDAP